MREVIGSCGLVIKRKNEGKLERKERKREICISVKLQFFMFEILDNGILSSTLTILIFISPYFLEAHKEFW